MINRWLTLNTNDYNVNGMMKIQIYQIIPIRELGFHTQDQ